MGIKKEGRATPIKAHSLSKALNRIVLAGPSMSVVTEGKVGAVIVFSLLAGIMIGLFVGYMMWVLRIFGCIMSAPC